MRDLEDVALSVTFDLTSLVKANRHLTVFTNNAMAGKDAMIMIADAASVTPNEIEDVAFWFGRAYAMIDSGRPMGEAVMRLTEMGLMSKEAASGLKKLEKAFSPKAQAKKMELLIASLKRFEGANSKLLGTLSGQASLFRDATTLAFKDIGDAIAPLTKKWLLELIGLIRQFRGDGTFQRWGKTVSSALEFARKKIEEFIPVAKSKFGELSAYFDILSAQAEEIGWGQTIANELEKGVDKGLQTVISSLEKYLPDFIDFGTKIGIGISKGILNAWVDFFGRQDIQKKIRNAMPFGNLIGNISDLSGDISGGGATNKTVLKNLGKLAGGILKEQYRFLAPGIVKSSERINNTLAQRGDPNWVRTLLTPLSSIDQKLTKSEESP